MSAFVVVKDNGSAVSRGAADYDGDSSRVTTALSSGVVSIVNNVSALMAIKDDGSAVSWGEANCGGNSSRAAAALASYRLHHQALNLP